MSRSGGGRPGAKRARVQKPCSMWFAVATLGQTGCSKRLTVSAWEASICCEYAWQCPRYLKDFILGQLRTPL